MYPIKNVPKIPERGYMIISNLTSIIASSNGIKGVTGVEFGGNNNRSNDATKKVITRIIIGFL